MSTYRRNVVGAIEPSPDACDLVQLDTMDSGDGGIDLEFMSNLRLGDGGYIASPWVGDGAFELGVTLFSADGDPLTVLDQLSSGDLYTGIGADGAVCWTSGDIIAHCASQNLGMVDASGGTLTMRGFVSSTTILRGASSLTALPDHPGFGLVTCASVSPFTANSRLVRIDWSDPDNPIITGDTGHNLTLYSGVGMATGLPGYWALVMCAGVSRLRSIEMSDPVPTPTDEIVCDPGANTMCVLGNIAWVGTVGGKLLGFDVSDPTDLTKVVEVSLPELDPGKLSGIQGLNGDFLAWATGSHSGHPARISIIDVTNPRQPIVVRSKRFSSAMGDGTGCVWSVFDGIAGIVACWESYRIESFSTGCVVIPI